MAWLYYLKNILAEPGDLIAMGGYPALAIVIFLETGALVFFLPGDSLLVVAGFYAAKGDLRLGVLWALLIPMAILGDATSYALGRQLGPALFGREDSRLLKPKHLAHAQAFYARHGGRAIVLARFVPVVRTFVPVVAGVAGMSYRAFASYNIGGGAAWIGSMTLIGYLLGTQYPALLAHTEKVVIVVVVLSVLPALWETYRGRQPPSKAH